MHVCHIITRLIVGGAQENTLLTCEGLRQRGYDVTLLSGPTTGPEGSLVDRARGGGYEVLEIPELVRAVNPWLDARARREMAYHLDRLKPDIVHTHSSKAGILGRLAACDARVRRIVHTIHGMSFNRTQPWLLRKAYAWVERRAARRTDAIVAVADAMIDQSVAARIAPRARFHTVYSGMEVERFDPEGIDRAAVRRAWGFGEEHIVVGAVARLFRRKGYEQLLPIMARVARRDPRLRFVWVGDGAQRGEYERELVRLGLAEKTRLTGLVPPEAVAEQLGGMDLLAHTSQWEGLPRVAVQALLMRTPVVAFAIDGTPEVVEDGVTGRLVVLNDLDAFAAALLELAGDADLRARMGSVGRERCRRMFDWRRMVAQLDELYQQLMRRG
ncbi:MAG: glycosyltransferase family 1 protein [Planctomycetota bacterium]|nr:MAG: glycosyltransferase family 1 protein [Planctomycetota bacterium]